MESSTAGSLSDYNPKETPSKGGGKAAGTGTADRCARAIEEVRLEEVRNCEFFTSRQGVPPTGTRVTLRDTLVEGRQAVATASGDVVIGYLPTSYNYLRICVAAGYSYSGKVTQSADTPTPRVVVSLAPST